MEEVIPYLNPNGFDRLSAFLCEHTCDLVTREQLEILATRDGTIVVLGGGAHDGLGIEVMRTEVSSDSVAVGLIDGNANVKFSDSLYEVLCEPHQ
jgi:hypothetical protein